jgi:hypothetical protein
LDVVRGGELVEALLPEPNDELGIVEPGVEAYDKLENVI